LHSNGYSLPRKGAFDHLKLKATDHVEELGTTVGEELLTPTRIYVKAIHALLDRFGKKGLIHGLAHITGEGLPGNVPRVLPKGKKAVLRKASWPVPPIFRWLQKNGSIDDDEMLTVFNMGIGFVVIVDPTAADKVQQRLHDDHGIPAYAIGEVKKGKPSVGWKS